MAARRNKYKGLQIARFNIMTAQELDELLDKAEAQQMEGSKDKSSAEDYNDSSSVNDCRKDEGF